MTKPPLDSQDQDRFSRIVANSLERSLSNLDPEIERQLDIARKKAQQAPERRWQGIAVAGLCLLLIFPLWQLGSPEKALQPEEISPAWYLTVEPELIADWEMLDAIGEIPDA